MEEEIWKDVEGYEGQYQISNLGNVKSLSRKRWNGKVFYRTKEKLLKPALDTKGYLFSTLSKKGKTKMYRVHTLVAMAFLNFTPCGMRKVINHKNFIKTDNRLENLEIVTNRENTNQKHLPSKSKYVGVHWCKKNKNWVSNIRVNGKKKYLGSFKDEEEASLYYENALKAIENGENIVVKRRETFSKYKFVILKGKKWAARPKGKHIGTFETEKEAHIAVLEYLSQQKNK